MIGVLSDLSRRRRIFDFIGSYFENMEREISQAVDDFFESHPMWDISKESLEPLAEISETNDKIIVSMDLPFVKKENIDLNVSEDSLELEAQLERCVQFEHWGTIQRECEFKRFHKIVALPKKVIPEEAKAKFKNGVLSIEIPKRRAMKGIKID